MADLWLSAQCRDPAQVKPIGLDVSIDQAGRALLRDVGSFQRSGVETQTLALLQHLK